MPSTSEEFNPGGGESVGKVNVTFEGLKNTSKLENDKILLY